ncbi:MAG: hypothetical protein ACRD2M_00470 [Terriglobales bacterium]
MQVLGVSPRFGAVHPQHQTPGPAVLLVGALTAGLAFFGDAILVPITEVGSLASAVGWLAACSAFLVMEKDARRRMIAGVGIVVSLALIAMKLLPFVPGHFKKFEFVALGVWVLLGLLLRRSGAQAGEQS